MDEPVDWALAERIATRVAARGTTPVVDGRALQRSMEPVVARAEALVAACTGLVPGSGPARLEVVDRPTWAAANIAGFRRLLAPVTEEWARRLSAGGRAGGASLAMTRRVAAVELGTLLGWLSGRVLGQYDLLLAGPDDPTGAGGDTVYLVGPNLVGLEQRFGFPPEEFRLWVLLHELTHRAQFTGVPWMRDHYLGLVRQAVSLADLDPGKLFATVRAAAQDRDGTRARMAEGGVAAVLATPEQRVALTRIAGLMALLEGHGDVTMTRAGGDLLPSAERFTRVLQARRTQANPIARTVQRLLGLEAKLNQYALGARFLAAIEDARGPHAVDRCWGGPDLLPTIDEIREPASWLERVDA